MTIKELKSNAPCYIRLPNDGDGFRCGHCKIKRPYNKVFQVFTPNGRVDVLCNDNEECLDPDWVAKAKDMGKWYD